MINIVDSNSNRDVNVNNSGIETDSTPGENTLPPTLYLPPIKSLSSNLNVFKGSRRRDDSNLMANSTGVQTEVGLDIAHLEKCIDHLSLLYKPDVRGSTRIVRTQFGRGPGRGTVDDGGDSTTSISEMEKNKDKIPVSLPPSTDTTSPNVLEILRADSFERAYAIRWLTTLVRRAEDLEAQEEEENDNNDKDEYPPYSRGRTREHDLIARAASLLAICAGASASGSLTRIFKFQLPSTPLISTPPPSYSSSSSGEKEYRNELEITLTDATLESQDFASVGALTWGAACVMAQVMAEDVESFFEGLQFGAQFKGAVSSPPSQHPEQFRVLELGAGTGLAGLTAAKVIAWVLRSSSSSSFSHTKPTLIPKQKTKAKVVLTDYFGSVLENLERNAERVRREVELASNSSGEGDADVDVDVEVRRLDWEEVACGESPREGKDGEEEKFDLILGSDIIYEAKHAEWIKAVVRRYLKVPSCFSDDEDKREVQSPLFHLLIPLRATHQEESRTVEEVFPLGHEFSKERYFHTTKTAGKDGDDADHLDLVILDREYITCDAYSSVTTDTRLADRGAEVEYVWYRIGWGWGSRVGK